VSEESDDENNEGRQSKRRRLNEEDLLRRSERRKWVENRATILFSYLQYSYYGKSVCIIIYDFDNNKERVYSGEFKLHICYLLLQSAIVVFEMAWNMSKDNLDMVWWAIVGSTEQSILSKVESRISVLEEGSLQAHVSRLTHRQGVDIDKQQQQQSIVKVTYDKEYPFT